MKIEASIEIIENLNAWPHFVLDNVLLISGTIKDDKTSLDVFKVTYTVGVNGKITANETHNGGNAAHTA